MDSFQGGGRGILVSAVVAAPPGHVVAADEQAGGRLHDTYDDAAVVDARMWAGLDPAREAVNHEFPLVAGGEDWAGAARGKWVPEGEVSG